MYTESQIYTKTLYLTRRVWRSSRGIRGWYKNIRYNMWCTDFLCCISVIVES
jgi:hypothetical protein